MIEIICTIISGIFALISTIFGGISIKNHKISVKQQSSGENIKQHIGNINNGEN